MLHTRVSLLSGRRWASRGPRILPLLAILLALVLLAGCASREPAIADSSSARGGSARTQPQTPIEPCPVADGESVFVTVSGIDKAFCEDFVSLLTASLQSECGLVPADSAGEADLTITLAVKDISLVAREGGRVNPSRALGNTALGTSLGLGIGALAGHREGGLVGAGIGAVIGLGVSLADTDANNVWTMKADLSLTHRGRARTQAYATTVSGMGMERAGAEMELKNRASQEIAAALRP